MDPEALGAELAAARDLFEAVGSLLRFTRTHEREFRLAMDRAEVRRGFLPAQRVALDHVKALAGLDLDPEDASSLGALLRRLAAQLGSPAVAARSIALAIDDAVGALAHPRLAAFAQRDVHPGSLVPISQPPLRAIFGRGLNSNPDRLGENVAGLAHVRIAPDSLGPYEVALSFEDGDALPELQAGDRVGVAVPYTSLTDFEWTSTGEPPDQRFFNVRPRCGAAQAEVLRKILEKAEASEVSVLVLPELCLDELGQAAIEEWWRDRRRSLRLLVAGSRHIEAEGRRRNRATTFAGARRWPHDKLSVFSFRPDGAPEGVHALEDVETMPARLVIRQSRTWSCATLICKDVLDAKMSELLRELRVRLVLVPAFTPKSAAFRARAAELAAEAQAIVLVANTPIGGSDAAIFGLPREKDSMQAVERTRPSALLVLPLSPAGKLIEC